MRITNLVSSKLAESIFFNFAFFTRLFLPGGSLTSEMTKSILLFLRQDFFPFSAALLCSFTQWNVYFLSFFFLFLSQNVLEITLDWTLCTSQRVFPSKWALFVLMSATGQSTHFVVKDYGVISRGISFGEHLFRGQHASLTIDLRVHDSVFSGICRIYLLLSAVAMGWAIRSLKGFLWLTLWFDSSRGGRIHDF